MPPKQKLGKTEEDDQKDDKEKKQKIAPKTCVHVVYAEFGDACILEFQSDSSKRFYLVDGGPLKWVLSGDRVEALTKIQLSKPYYQYLLYALTSLTQIPDTTGIKLDGALVTHPDADHLDGVERLFRQLLPPTYQVGVTKENPDKRLICNGPVLLTKKFSDDYEAYSSFSDFLLDSEFEISLDPADILNAFENEMVFTFPSSPGVLYQRRKHTKKKPYDRAKQEKKLEGCVDDSDGDANKSSILLYTEKGGKICLNGDAHGYDIAAMLVRQKANDLDIFKLSHHGSPKNSILRKVSPPPWVYQNLAAMILLSISLNKPILFPKKPGEERDICSFRSQMKNKIPSHKNGVTLPQVADAFLKAIKKKLKNKKIKPEDLLNEIKEKYEEILAAIQLPTGKDDPYEDLKTLDQLADWEELMKDVASTLSLEKVPPFVRRVMGKHKIFTDYFNGKVGIVAFFESFHSKTYYVSANNRHGHPDPDVIKGIIKAAVKKNKSCRIVFTSGGAVPSTHLPDGNDIKDKAFKNWNKLVYLYYLNDNVSFKLDPTQNIKTAPEGTAMFTDDDTVRTNVTEQLEENFGFTIPHRTFLPSLDKYYVEVKGEKGEDYWLDLESDGSLSLSSNKKAIVVSNANTFQGDLRVITLETEQKDDDADTNADGKTNAKTTKKDGKKTTKKGKKTTTKTKETVKKAIQKNVWLELFAVGEYLIRESAEGNYFKEEKGSLKTTSDVEEAVIFCFKHTTFSALYAPENEDNVFISLMEFLKKSHGHESEQATMNVKTVLEALLGLSNVKLLVKNLPSDFIGIKALDHDVALKSSTVELSVDHKVISSKIEVAVTSPSMTFNSNLVTKLEIVVKDLSSKPSLTLLVSTSLHHVSYEIDISEDLKPRKPSVDMYLNALGDVSQENRDNLTLGILLQRVMGLLPLEALSNCLLSQLLSNKIFTWKVDRFLSTVNYFVSPLAVEVLSGDFYIVIPPQMKQISFGGTIIAEFSNIHVMIRDPRTEKSDFVIECDAKIGSVPVSLKMVPTSTNLPEVIISFPEKALVTSVFNILGLEDSISDLSVPLVNKTIRSLQLSKPKIYVAQDVQGYKVTRISSLSFQFSFDNFASVLPSSLSSFKESKASVTIFNPLSSHLQLGFEVEFKLPVSSSSNDNEFLKSKFTLWPVDTSNITSSEGYACTISLLPTHSGISIESTLQAVGLGHQMSSMFSSFPFISKLVDGVLLEEMSLEVNSQKRSVETFSLSLSVPKCSIVEEKLTMQNGKFLVQYGCGQWYAKADMELLVFNKFVCSAAFSLPRQDEPGSLTIENMDDSLTFSAFLKGIGIAAVDDVPIINEVLDVSISRAALTCENHESSFKLTKIEAVIRKRFLTVGSIHLYNLELGICYANVQGSPSVSLSLQGYLNPKTHASLTYDAEQRELIGHYIIMETTSFDECMGDLFAKQIKDFSSSSAFQKIKTLHVQEVKVILDFPRGKGWFLKEFLVNIEGTLSLGPFNLQQLRLVYKKIDQDDEEGRDVSVQGHFKSDDESVSFMVDLSCTTKEANGTTFSALIKPDAQGGLTLSSFLKVVGLPIKVDDVPQVNGSPDFLNIELKEAFLQFEVSPFRIRKLDIAVKTITTIQLLEKPHIQLQEARLEYHFDGTKDPSETEIYIAGRFVIAKFGLDVTLKKDAKKGVVLEGRFIQAKSSRKIDFEKAAKQLSPDVPFSLAKNVALSSFLFKLEKNPETTCIKLEGESQTNWTLDAGFSKITIKNLGGKLDYTKNQSSQAWTGSVYLTGSIILQGSIPVTVAIYHDSKDGTMVIGNVNEPKKVDLNVMTKTFAAGPDSSKTWKALVPKESKTAILSPEFTSASMLINFTEKYLLFYGSVEGFGTGLLMVKKTENKENSSKYGFLFGLSLGADFRFSALDQSLSVVDDVISVEHANLSLISMEQVTVKEIIADFSKLQGQDDKEKEGDASKTGQAKEDSSKSQGEGDEQKDVDVPFTDLDDQSISGQELKRGMTAVAKIKFCDGNSRLLSNVSQIQEEDKKTEIVLFGHIAEQAEDTVFMATIKEMTLFGGHLTLNEISLEYQPSKGKSFTLDGSLSLLLTDDSNPIVFSGTLKITESKADFSTKVGSKPGTIHAPFGMFGISIEDPQLHLSWQFDQDKKKKNETKKQSTLPICSISGSVQFSKSDSTSKKGPLTLKGSILFQGGKPEVAMISFEPSHPLSLDDLFFTLFKKNWPSGYLDISFKKGEIYYAKEQVKISGKKYEKGFCGETHIEIFGHCFDVSLSVDKKGFKVEGGSEPEIELNFATLARKDFKNGKGPEIDISRYEDGTTFELSAGIKILQEKIGSCSIGYNITKKCFIGAVTYSGKLLGLDNPSIEFEWSHKKKFKIRKWPVNLDLGDRINFAKEFEKLSKMDKTGCKELVGLAFDQVIKTKCKVHVASPDTSTDPKAWFALKVQGSIDIMIVKLDHPALTVEFPELTVSVTKPKSEFRLSDLPEFLLDEIAKNSINIAKQVFKHPTQLTKFMAALGGIKLSRQIISGLICRGCKSENVTEQAETECEKMQKETTDDEETLDDAFDTITKDAAEGASLADLAADAGAVGEAAGDVLAGLAALISFLAGIIAFFTGKSKEQKEAERRRDEAKKKKETARKIVEGRLKITGLTMSLPSKDEVEVTWKFLEKDVKYNVTLSGIDIGGEMTCLSNTTTEENKVKVKNDKVKFDNKQFIARVQATYKGFKGETKIVSKTVTPLLPPPTKIEVESKRDGRELDVTFSPVKFATEYKVQVVNHPSTVIGGAIVTLPSEDKEGKHVFDTKNFKLGEPGMTQVGVSALRQEDGPQEFKYSSTELYLVEAPSHVDFSYETKLQKLSVKWKVTDIQKISGYVCEIQSVKGDVVFSKYITKPKGDTLESNMEIQLNEISNKGESPYHICVRSLGEQGTLASVFVNSKEQISFLTKVQDISPLHDPKTNQLCVSWSPLQGATKYEVSILDQKDHSNVARKSIPDGKTSKVVFEMDQVKLNCEVKYVVSVIAEGSDTHHLPSAPSLATVQFSLLPKPASVSQEYSFKEKTVKVTFKPVPQAETHLIEIFNVNSPTEIEVKPVAPKPPGDWPSTMTYSFDVGFLKPNDAGPFKSRVIAQGNTYKWINSLPCVSPTELKRSEAPTSVVLTYFMITKELEVLISSKPGKFTGTVGDTAHKDKQISKQTFVVEHQTGKGHSALTTTLLKVPLNLADKPLGAKYQATIVNDGDQTYLPSVVKKSREVLLLDPPASVTQKYDQSGHVLTVAWKCVQSAAGYSVKVYNTKTESIAAEEEITSGLRPAGEEMKKDFSLETLLLQSNGLYQALVMVMGDKFSIGGASTTSTSSISSCPSPNDVSIAFDNDTRHMRVGCSPVNGTVSIKLGVIDSEKLKTTEGNVQKALLGSKVVTISSNDGKPVVEEIAIDDSVLFKSHDTVYKGVAQILGVQGKNSLPSGFSISSDKVTRLKQPVPIHMSFDPQKSTLKVTWTTVDLATGYLVEIQQTREDEGKESTLIPFSQVAPSDSVSCNFSIMNITIEETDRFVAKVLARGNPGSVIDSTGFSIETLVCEDSPFNVDVSHVDDETVSASWEAHSQDMFQFVVLEMAGETEEQVITKEIETKQIASNAASLGLTSPGCYKFGVRALGSVDKLPSVYAKSDFCAVIMDAPSALEKPHRVVMLQWHPVKGTQAQDFSHYIIWRRPKLDEQAEWKREEVDLSMTEKTITDLQPYEDYVFCISVASATRGCGIRSQGTTVCIFDKVVRTPGNLIDSPNLEPVGNFDWYGNAYRVNTDHWELEETSRFSYILEKRSNEPDKKYHWNIAVANTATPSRREQTIDLLAKGLAPEYLDEERPTIEAYEWFAISSAGRCEIKVTLLDDSKNQLGGQEPFSKCLNIHNGDGSWQRLEQRVAGYGPGLRFIRFEDSLEGLFIDKMGFDVRAFGATVTFPQSPSTKYETMVNEQINFSLQTMYNFLYMSSLKYADDGDRKPNMMMSDQSQCYFGLAEVLLHSQWERGGRVVLSGIKNPDMGHSTKLVKACETALALAKESDTRLKKIRGAAVENDDRDVVQQIDQFLDSQTGFIRNLDELEKFARRTPREVKDLEKSANLIDYPNFYAYGGFSDDGLECDPDTRCWEMINTHGCLEYRLENKPQPGIEEWPEQDRPYPWNVAIGQDTYDCTRVQIIDLLAKGFKPEYLDEMRPTIEAYEWFAFKEGGGYSYEIKVSLLDKDKNELQGLEPFTQRQRADMGKPGSWRRLGHTFTRYPPGLRFIRFESGCLDGHQMKNEFDLKAYEPTVKLSKSTKYERGINERIHFEMQTTYELLFMACLTDDTHEEMNGLLMELSHQLWFSQAVELMDFQEKRGISVVLQDIKKPDAKQLGSSFTDAEAREAALKLSKEIKTSLTQLKSLAEKNKDPEMVDFIEECLQRQEESIIQCTP